MMGETSLAARSKPPRAAATRKGPTEAETRPLQADGRLGPPDAASQRSQRSPRPSRLLTLLELSRALSSELDMDRLLQLIMRRATELLDADRSTLFVLDPEKGELWSRVAQGEGIAEIRIPRSAGIAGHVVSTGEIVNIQDAYRDPRFNQEVDRQTGYRTRTIVCVPVRNPKSEIVGVLQVLNRRRGAFNAEDESLLTALASQAAVALENAAHLEERRREAHRLGLLLDVMRSLSAELELDRLLPRIIATTTEVMRADRSSLFLVDPKTNELWFKVAEGSELREVRLPMGVGIAGNVAQTGDTVNIADAYQDPRFNPEFDRQTGYRTRTMLCMPMRDSASGKIVGVLQVLNKRQGLFSRDDEELLAAFGSQAVIAIYNASLFDQVVSMKNYNDSILRSMASGVVTIDPEERIASANPAARRILVLAEDMPPGAPLLTVAGEANQALLDVVASVRETGKPRSIEKLKYFTPRDDQALVNVTSVPLLDSKERSLGQVMVMEDITKEQLLTSTLSRVVSRQVAEQFLAGGGDVKMGGERRDVTILMSDIRDFTTISETHEPEEVVAMLNDYFARMITLTFKHEGTLDKFIGDAFMAVFGAPIAHPDHQLRAVRAAMDMRRELWRFNTWRQEQGKSPIQTGIGICNGVVLSGTIGSEERLEYTVIGDAVNLSARLESLTKEFPDHKILFNEAVYDALGNTVSCDRLGEEKVKGKTKPVVVYGISESTCRALDPSVASAGRG